MLKGIIKTTISFILLIAFFFSFGYFLLDTQAANKLANTFVPSATTIDQLEAESAYIPSFQGQKVFNEYTEESIDKMGFYIRIDKINLFKMVVKNVDPRYIEVYKKSWESGVSHGKFTSYPDQIGITYIFGHASNSRESAADEYAWFTYLDELVTGDEVIIYYQGKKYFYDVSEIRAVEPTATGFYTGASAIPMVRLQYCGPPTGSLNSRTLVDAILVDTVTL